MTITNYDPKKLEEIEQLVKEINDSEAYFRAIRRLWRIQDYAALDVLLQALNNQNPEIRASAARTISNYENNRAVEPLIKLLSDSNIKVRTSAAVSLGHLKDGKAIEPLIKIVADKTEDADLRFWSVGALVPLGASKAGEILIFILQDKNENESIRQWATYACSGLNIRAASPILLAILQDKKDPIRGYAGQALAELEQAEAIEPLLKAIHDRKWVVRYNILEALRDLEISNPAINAAVLKLLDDKVGEVRYMAAHTAGLLRIEEALPKLEWMMKNDNTKVEIDGEENENIPYISRQAIRWIKTGFDHWDVR